VSYQVGLNLRDFVLTRRTRRGELEALANACAIAIKFGAELLQQQRVVGLIRRAVVVACMTQNTRIFPVDIKPIEKSCRRRRSTRGVTSNTSREVAFEEHINTG